MTLQTLIAATCLAVPGLAFAAPGIPRVRDIGDPQIAALIAEATARSATFRRLVAVIDDSDGIVYVERGACGHSARACLSHSLVVAGPHRIIRVLLDTRRDRDELLAALGHELRHAVEVLGRPQIRSMSAVMFFYQYEGFAIDGRFETEAALQTEEAVFAELKRAETQNPVIE
jgi:hypothetical protein